MLQSLSQREDKSTPGGEAHSSGHDLHEFLGGSEVLRRPSSDQLLQFLCSLEMRNTVSRSLEEKINGMETCSRLSLPVLFFEFVRRLQVLYGE